MTDDLVARLRDSVKYGHPGWHQPCIKAMAEAADRIEELERKEEDNESFKLWETRDPDQSRKYTIRRMTSPDIDFWYYPDLYIGRIDIETGSVWLRTDECDDLRGLFR